MESGNITKRNMLMVLILISLIGISCAEQPRNGDWLNPGDTFGLNHVGSYSPMFDLDGMPMYRYYSYWHPYHSLEYYYVPYTHYYYNQYPIYRWSWSRGSHRYGYGIRMK